jgi:uncharacterized protein YbjT (DUF2867 family)
MIFVTGASGTVGSEVVKALSKAGIRFRVGLLSGLVNPERNVVREARPAGVKRIVKLSVWDAPEEAFSFAKWHRPVERDIEKTGLLWTFLRPTGFMQNVVNHMGATIKAQGAFYQPAGDARISFVDARDGPRWPRPLSLSPATRARPTH